MSNGFKKEQENEDFLRNFKTRSLPLKSNSRNEIHKFRKFSNSSRIYNFTAEKARAIEKEWSDNLMADFDKLIAKELTQLRIDAEKERLEEKKSKISTSPTSDSSGSSSNGSTGSLKKNPRVYKRSLSDGPNLPIRAPTGKVTQKCFKQNGHAVLVKVSPLSEDEIVPARRASDSELPPRKPRRIPSPEKIRELFRSTSPFRKSGKKEITSLKNPPQEEEKFKVISNEFYDEPPPLPAKKKKEPVQERKIPIELQNFLTKIRPQGRNSSPLRDESPGDMTSSGFNPMDSSIGETEDIVDMILENPSVSIATQTSPALSRSSSFTWMSDCSSSVVLNTPGSLSDANDDKSSTSSDHSSSSPELPKRLRCDNGCGSECDCGTSGSRDSSPESTEGSDVKCKFLTF